MAKEILDKVKEHLTPDEYEELEKLILYDPLTSVKNRRTFDDEIVREIHRTERTYTDLCLLIADIDYFKEVNDNYGHQKGDEVLIDIASVLRNNIRDIDTVYRYGGEEFTILLPNTNLEGGYTVAENLRAIVEKNTMVTLSIGLAQYEPLSQDIKGLIQKADMKMYEAKNNGRNLVLY